MSAPGWDWWLWPWNWRKGAAPTARDLLLTHRHSDTGILGAVEACVSLWSDAVAAAVVESRYPIPAAELACLTREFLIRGEAVRRLDVEDGRPVLIPATVSDVHGTAPRPETWRYLLTVAAPDGNGMATYPAARVLHWRRAPSVQIPWCGRSVLTDSPALASLAGAVERSLLGEHAVPVSRVMDLRVPWRQKNAQKQEHAETLPVANLAGDGSVVVQHLDRGMEAKGDIVQRVGAQPDQASVELRDQLRRDVAAAFGCPPGLVFAESGSAQSTRELRTLWLRSRVLPLLSTLGAELARVFDAPVAFTLPLVDSEQAEADSRQRQRRATAIGALMARGLSRDDAVSLYDTV